LTDLKNLARHLRIDKALAILAVLIVVLRLTLALLAAAGGSEMPHGRDIVRKRVVPACGGGSGTGSLGHGG
jgi:uncharacterized membrane protein YccF (DUF307 family)